MIGFCGEKKKKKGRWWWKRNEIDKEVWGEGRGKRFENGRIVRCDIFKEVGGSDMWRFVDEWMNVFEIVEVIWKWFGKGEEDNGGRSEGVNIIWGEREKGRRVRVYWGWGFRDCRMVYWGWLKGWWRECWRRRRGRRGMVGWLRMIEDEGGWEGWGGLKLWMKGNGGWNGEWKMMIKGRERMEMGRGRVVVRVRVCRSWGVWGWEGNRWSKERVRELEKRWVDGG